MELLTTAGIAIGSIIATKALEKTGENIGQALWDKIDQFINALKKQSPQTATALEQAPEQPLDYQQTVKEVESAAKLNPEVEQAMEELAAAAQKESNPKFNEVLSMPSLQKLAEKIGQVVMPGGTGNIGTQSF